MYGKIQIAITKVDDMLVLWYQVLASGYICQIDNTLLWSFVQNIVFVAIQRHVWFANQIIFVHITVMFI